ncbi:MAG: protoglobin domain-containing protein [Myxococcota bacterium]
MIVVRLTLWALLAVSGCSKTIPSAASAPKSAKGTAMSNPRITVADLEVMKKSVLFSDEDVKYLRMSRDVLEPQTDAILDTWYGFVASQPHLLAYFSSAAGEVQPEYLDAVRVRFGQWILDTADANYHQDWLDYQLEIGRRHHRVGKNRTDNANAVDHIHLRHVTLLTLPITHTLRPFLEAGDHSAEDVDKMHQAWVKSVLLQVTLWSYPYVITGDF